MRLFSLSVISLGILFFSFEVTFLPLLFFKQISRLCFSVDIVYEKSKVVQSCPILCNPMDCSPPGSFLHPWDFPGKNTGVGCHFLLQGIFLTQESKPGLPRCRQTLYHLSHPWKKHLYYFPSNRVMSSWDRQRDHPTNHLHYSSS